MKLWIIVGIVLIAPAQVVADGCQSDGDCKGDRVCYKGECLSASVAEQYEQKDFEKANKSESKDDDSVQEASDASPSNSTVSSEASSKADIPSSPSSQTVQNTTATETIADPDNLGPNQSAISVMLKKPSPGAVVYVDERQMGSLPWLGVVAPGEHTIRVEAPGKRPKKKKVDVWPNRIRSVQLKMRTEGNYVPFGVMTAVSTITLSASIAGAVMYADEKSALDNCVLFYSSVQNDALKACQELHSDAAKSWAVVMGVNIAAFAISLPLAILFGRHPDRFGKKKRADTVSLAPIVGPAETGLFVSKRF